MTPALPTRIRGVVHLGRGADDTAGVVMLREPIAMVTQHVAMPGEFERLTDRSILRAALRRRRLIEYRQSHGCLLSEYL
jgi:hypothetical protein